MPGITLPGIWKPKTLLPFAGEKPLGLSSHPDDRQQCLFEWLELDAVLLSPSLKNPTVSFQQNMILSFDINLNGCS